MIESPKRVAVGMSGGLDSSVVAALLADQGHDVIGLTLRMFREGSRCCSVEDIRRSQRMCTYLGLRHFSVNAIEAFDDMIIKPFVDDYAHGRTPSPCVLCNEYIKFGILHQRALQLGCTHIATGHYVRVEQGEGRWRLFRGGDQGKDQSYFLHRLTQDQLGRCLFPLATMRKKDVAIYAEQRELPVSTSSKQESQDLCFVSDHGHAQFVETHRPHLKRVGEIVDTSGQQLGRHGGHHRYTIGQRRGLGVAATERLYVKEIDAEENRVMLAQRNQVMHRRCDVEAMHWIVERPTQETLHCTARVRYRHQAAHVSATLLEGNRAKLEFKEPQFAITPGQAAVLYDGDEVLGGGWITGGFA